MTSTINVGTDIGTTRVVHTACTLDCPDGCSLAVTVTDTSGPATNRFLRLRVTRP